MCRSFSPPAVFQQKPASPANTLDRCNFPVPPSLKDIGFVACPIRACVSSNSASAISTSTSPVLTAIQERLRTEQRRTRERLEQIQQERMQQKQQTSRGCKTGSLLKELQIQVEQLQESLQAKNQECHELKTRLKLYLTPNQPAVQHEDLTDKLHDVCLVKTTCLVQEESSQANRTTNAVILAKEEPKELRTIVEKPRRTLRWSIGGDTFGVSKQQSKCASLSLYHHQYCPSHLQFVLGANPGGLCAPYHVQAQSQSIIPRHLRPPAVVLVVPKNPVTDLLKSLSHGNCKTFVKKENDQTEPTPKRQAHERTSKKQALQTLQHTTWSIAFGSSTHRTLFGRHNLFGGSNLLITSLGSEST